MSLNLNKAVIAGRLTATPELKKANNNGINVTSFTVAVNRPKPKDGGEQQADFINCVAWRSTAEFVSKYFEKGMPICVSGKIQTRSWQDNNGNKRYATEIVADEVNFVESKSSAPASDSHNPYTPDATSTMQEVGPDDDLPF